MANPAKGYIEIIGGGGVNYGSSGKLTFMYNPEEVSESYEVGWTSIKIPGLPLPIKQYVGGGEREISFTLQLAMPNADPQDEESLMQVDLYIRDLYNLGMPMVPDEGNFQFYMPPILRLVMGNNVTTCVLTKVGVSRKFFDKNLNTTVAEVEVSFQQILIVNY